MSGNLNKQSGAAGETPRLWSQEFRVVPSAWAALWLFALFAADIALLCARHLQLAFLFAGLALTWNRAGKVALGARLIWLQALVLGANAYVAWGMRAHDAMSRNWAMLLAAVLALLVLVRGLHGLLYGAASAPKPRSVAGQGSFLRTSVSGMAATAVDFCVFSFLFRFLELSPPLATLIGCGVGAVVNFAINRLWAFQVAGRKRHQAARYLFVTTASALLNAGLVKVGLWLPSDAPTRVWWVARGLVFAFWNHPMNRDYVFKRANAKSSPEGF